MALAERLFVEAALLAPLSRALRRAAVRSWWEEGFRRYHDRSRFTAIWAELVWPNYLRAPEPHRFPATHRALCAQLSQPELYQREQAAYCVWLLHAIPQLASDRFEQLHELAVLVLRAALETQNHFLRRLAIHIWEVKDPTVLGRCLDRLGGARHVAFSPVFLGARNAVDQSLGFIHSGVDALQSGPPSAQRLLFVWDLASGVAAHLGPDELKREASFLAGRGSLLTMAWARAGHGAEAGERFVVGARTRPAEGLTLGQAIRNTLAGQSDRPLPVLRRRLATFLLRQLDEPDRVALAQIVLVDASDEHPFVRLSAISSLQDTGCTAAIPVLQHVLSDCLAAHRRHPDMAHVTLDALVALDPVASEPSCRHLATSRTLHRARAAAVRALGDLWRKERPDDQVGLLLRLLEQLPHREFALNLARVLFTPFSTPFLPSLSLARAWDARSRYRSPL